MKLTILFWTVLLYFNTHLLGIVTSCEFHNKLRGKWFFNGENHNTNMRVKSRVVIFKVSQYLKLRYRCIERDGNTYLLRNTVRGKKHEVLCLGFIYVADHTYGEYLVSRMIAQGHDSFLFSPKEVPHPRSITIDNTCDSHISRERKFIVRKGNECRLPREMLGTWGFTLRQSSSLTIGRRNLTIHYLNNQHLTLNCEAKDDNKYLFRRPAHYNSSLDAVMCFVINPVVDDPYYSYEVTRIIAGNDMEGQIRSVPRGHHLNIHQDCDMIDSPARPEYIYRIDSII